MHKPEKYLSYFYFLPFLAFYSVLILKLHTDEMIGDEERYIVFANNLLHGFYSPPFPDITLISGPGYPIFLMPFVALHVPLIVLSLLNGVLHYLSIVFLFKSVRLFLSFKRSIFIALCWGFYFLAYQEMPCILSESFTIFLITFISFNVFKMFQSEKINVTQLIVSGIFLGWLVLTKVIFAYVLLFLFIFFLLLWIFKRTSLLYQKSLLLLLIGLLTLSPYVLYTYRLTGKVFYLSNAGGSVLYWMSAPNEKEYGDWNNMNFDANCSESFCNADLIRVNHQEDIQKMRACSNVIEMDDLSKQIAISNIKAHPVKYVKNWFANIGRLLYGFPASYYFQSPVSLVRIFINSFLLVFMLFSLMITLKNWKSMPFGIRFILLLVFVYLGLSSLMSAYPRQLNVVIPVLLLWIGYCFTNSIQFSLNWNKKE